MSNTGGYFFFPKFLLTNPADVLEYTVGFGTLPEDQPRNSLWEASGAETSHQSYHWNYRSELNSAMQSSGVTASLQMSGSRLRTWSLSNF